jgi:hypothetical protein
MGKGMGSKQQAVRRDSFVVRIWRERDRPGWQGWVQHTGTGESAPVRDREELWAFIEERAGALAEDAPTGLQ